MNCKIKDIHMINNKKYCYVKTKYYSIDSYIKIKYDISIFEVDEWIYLTYMSDMISQKYSENPELKKLNPPNVTIDKYNFEQFYEKITNFEGFNDLEWYIDDAFKVYEYIYENEIDYKMFFNATSLNVFREWIITNYEALEKKIKLVKNHKMHLK